MDRRTSRALLNIRASVAAGRFRLGVHFRERLAERGLLWSDVLAVLDDPADVLDDGADRYERPKWRLAGDAADGLPIEFVCALDRDARGIVTVFITLYVR
jgi:hypothetical protein